MTQLPLLMGIEDTHLPLLRRGRRGWLAYGLGPMPIRLGVKPLATMGNHPRFTIDGRPVVPPRRGVTFQPRAKPWVRESFQYPSPERA